MNLSRLLTILWLYDRSKKFDEMYAATTQPKQTGPATAIFEGAAIPQGEIDACRRAWAEQSEWKREQAEMKRRRAVADQFKTGRDHKPFRIFSHNALSTTLYWIQGRKLFAETYEDDGRRGYVVYEGIDMDMRFYSPHDFSASFGRWVDDEI